MADGAGAAVPGKVAELWDRFRPSIMARVDVLERAVVSLLEDGLEDGDRREAEREAHKLAGSVGTFGFTEASRHARSIELALEGDRALQPADALRLSEAVLALRAALERPPTGSRTRRDRPGLLLLTRDADLAERVSMEAAARGFEVRQVEDEAGARAQLASMKPAAMLLDLPLAGPGDPYALMEEAAATRAAPAIIVLAAGDGFAERVEAAKRGGAVFLRRPASPLQIVDLVEQALRRTGAGGASVLVVDDDPAMLQLLDPLLTERGTLVRTVEDPAEFWTELRRTRPDLVILDVEMPGLNGIDLCRAIRADPRWATLPVLFLTGRTDAQTVQAIFAAGADDYIPKPVVGPELLTRIDNRLARSDVRGDLAGRGGPRGMAGRKQTRDDLQRLLHIARRCGHSLVLVRLAIDDLGRLVDALGPQAGEGAMERVATLLEKAVSPGDVLGWWGGGGFALGLFAGEAEVAAARVEDLRRILAAESVESAAGPIHPNISTGIAVYPGDGHDLASLLAATESALAEAREGGGGRAVVRRPGGNVAGVEMVDVVLVEDDAVVAELLLHALAIQGYSARWIANGDEAVAALAGPPPAVRGRVILLDVDLPGRDGLSVLRVLARARITGRSHVVMLTVRSTEKEVLAALESGATDHIAKPFSVPVLLRRVRALLERG